MLSLNPNFAAQRLCAAWYGPAYYEGLARAFAHRLHWGILPTDSRVHRTVEGIELVAALSKLCETAETDVAPL